ncbi:MAG: hypothetical protein JXA01_01755 [Dehalococcoidia bacterium]|nr:hypothetical protein [Dehalococcoidia bacterium]
MIEYLSKYTNVASLLMMGLGLPSLIVLSYTITMITIDCTLSVGEIIAIAVSIPGTLTVFVALFYFLRNQYRLKNPFVMTISLDPVRYGIGENRKFRHVSKKLELETNSSKNIILVITSRQPYSTNRFHLFFNAQKSTKGHAPKHIIEIANVQDENKETWKEPYYNYKSVPDEVGGIDVFYDNAPEKAPDDHLYLTATIRTYGKPWKGYLIFYTFRNDRNRGYAYLDTEVKPNHAKA